MAKHENIIWPEDEATKIEPVEIVEEVKNTLPSIEIPETKAEEEIVEEVPEEEEAPVEEEEAPVEETKDGEEAIEEEEAEVPADEIVEEEKEIEKVPLAGIPARKEDVEYTNVAKPEPVTAPSYTIDAKAVADAVIEEVWSKLNFKRAEIPSVNDEYRKTENITTKSKFLDNDVRDRFGRNKKYL